MSDRTIEEIIDSLEQIIQTSKETENPLGYFAALYQKVTITIKDKLGTDYFDDDARMEKLDVTFASRYLKAYTDYQKGKPISKSWEVAFVAAKDERYIVLQHLLFGMNAHINLDLGIAAAEITNPSTIASLESDFNKINVILGELTNEVQEDLAKIWPRLLWILKFFKKTDDYIVNFGMNIARESAWKFANEIVVKNGDEKQNKIDEKDEKVAGYGKLLKGKGWIERAIIGVIRRREIGNVKEKIEALEE
ncbi:MAG: hypothetical protein HRT58_08910 [Crocinitomicaceae bacterium]|nr:DUF5995 family protein [Flavobacteriales bacterium]NQZ35771.1 hypothetical protein [Crocinitomicaceae bacterium]